MKRKQLRRKSQDIINAVVRYRSLAVDHVVSFWAWICDSFNIFASYTSRDLWDKLHLWLCYIKSRLILDYPEKQRLLEWVKANIAMNRRPSEAVRRFSLCVQSATDFRNCWKDGILLCALVEALVPGSCPRYDLLNPEHKTDNLELGLKLVEKKIGIIPEIDIDDVIKGSPNSEKQIACLLAQMKVASSKLKLRPVIKRPETEDEEDIIFDEEQECLARGMGLMLAVRGRQARFNIFLKSLYNLNIVIEIKGPNSLCSERITPRSPRRKNSLEANSFEKKAKSYKEIVFKKIPFEYQLYPGKISVGYTPVYSGQHKLSIIWRGQHIMGSPYVVSVDVPSCSEGSDSKEIPISYLPENRHCSNDHYGEQQKEEPRPKFGMVTRKRILRHIITVNGKDLVVEAGCNEDLPTVLGKICRESVSAVDEKEEWDEAQENLTSVQKTDADISINEEVHKMPNGLKAAHYPFSSKNISVRTLPSLGTVLEGIGQIELDLTPQKSKNKHADFSRLPQGKNNPNVVASSHTVNKQQSTVEQQCVSEKSQISSEDVPLLDICEAESPEEQNMFSFEPKHILFYAEQNAVSNSENLYSETEVKLQEIPTKQYLSSLSVPVSQEQSHNELEEHFSSSTSFINSMLVGIVGTENTSSKLPLSNLDTDIKPHTRSVVKAELMKFEVPPQSHARLDTNGSASFEKSHDEVNISAGQNRSCAEDNSKRTASKESVQGNDVLINLKDINGAQSNTELLITEKTISEQAENLKKLETQKLTAEDSDKIHCENIPCNGKVLSSSASFDDNIENMLHEVSDSLLRNSDHLDYFYSYISSDAEIPSTAVSSRDKVPPNSSSFSNQSLSPVSKKKRSEKTIVNLHSAKSEITEKPSFSSITTEITAIDQPIRTSYHKLLQPSKSESNIVRNRVQEWERVMNSSTNNEILEPSNLEKEILRPESPILVSVRSRKAFWESGCVSSMDNDETPPDSSSFVKVMSAEPSGSDVSREISTDFPKPATVDKAIQVNLEEIMKQSLSRRELSQGYHAATPDSEDSGISDSRRSMHHSASGSKHTSPYMPEVIGSCGRTNRGTVLFPQESLSSEYTDMTSECDRGFIDDEIPDYANFLLDNYVSFTGLLDTERPISRKELLKYDYYPNTDDVFREPSTPKPEKCKVFGTGVYYGQVYLRNHFQVRTRGAGPGYLTVNIQGSGIHDVTEITTMYSGNDLYDVLYEVSQPGYYLISIKWGDFSVPESPFICKVTY